MTWEIVLGLIALFGFGVAVVTPIIKLNTSITKLNASIDRLNEKMVTSEEKVKELGATLADHEKRIIRIEGFTSTRL